MEIFNIGTGELLFILLLALLVLGPRRIPEVARTLGRALRELRAISNEFTTALTREVEAAERAERIQRAAQERAAQARPAPSPTEEAAAVSELPPLVEAAGEDAPADGAEGEGRWQGA